MTTAPVRLRFRAWTAAVALLLGLFTIQVLPQLRFETDILALLPRNAADPEAGRALDRFADQLGRNALFLVSGPDFATARAGAEAFTAKLRSSPAFASVDLQADAGWPARAAAAYAPYRDGVLSDHDRALLAAGDDTALLGQARQALYTPAAFLRRTGAGDDPLDLLGDFLTRITPASSGLSLRDGVLAGADPPPATTQYVLVHAVLAANAFSTREEESAGLAVDAATAAARAAGAGVDGSGVIGHAVAASRLARHEINLFGGVQLALLAGLLLLVFRSPRALALSALVLGVGVVAALAMCHYLMGSVHVLTLVFCSNLAGVAIDYSIYYCADQFRAPGRWRAEDALAAIGPAIGMSCIAAVMSYALLAVAPFPGLRQMALFCCVGLTVAYLGVMAWFPRLVRPAPANAALRLHCVFSRALVLRERLVAWRPWWLWPVAAAIAALGLARLQFADQVQVLQPRLLEPLRQEQVVQARLGQLGEGRFFLVRAADEESVLQTEEALRARLDGLIAHHALDSYSAVSRELPSAARQAADHRLLAPVYAEGGLAERFMRELGFGAKAIAARQAAFAAGTQPLLPAAWLATPAADPYRHLWLGAVGVGDKLASVVTLAGVHDSAALATAAEGIPGVRLVDRAAEVNQVLQRYRRLALWIVAGAALASAVLLAVPYGALRGLRLMIAPSTAAAATLGVLGLCGEPVTFFHIVALHLILGLGMEYAILLCLPELRGPSTLLAVSLAAALALIAFGLLALSTTPFIHAIGLTVAIGVVLGFACAALLGTIPRTAPAWAGSERTPT